MKALRKAPGVLVLCDWLVVGWTRNQAHSAPVVDGATITISEVDGDLNETRLHFAGLVVMPRRAGLAAQVGLRDALLPRPAAWWWLPRRLRVMRS